EIIQLLSLAGITPTIPQEAVEAMTILGLVAAGLGISIVTKSFNRMKVDGVHYLHFANSNAISEVWLVSHNKRTIPA
ncbi:LysR substrate-binding domain-containing protein, partial [Proteus mirabilis]|uniref:LysR substrate-binding domain-containing protein n=1 Tax=Proteus mirabilis TaxID=584 RepID=UPI002574FCBC